MIQVVRVVGGRPAPTRLGLCDIRVVGRVPCFTALTRTAATTTTGDPFSSLFFTVIQEMGVIGRRPPTLSLGLSDVRIVRRIACFATAAGTTTTTRIEGGTRPRFRRWSTSQVTTISTAVRLYHRTHVGTEQAIGRRSINALAIVITKLSRVGCFSNIGSRDVRKLTSRGPATQITGRVGIGDVSPTILGSTTPGLTGQPLVLETPLCFPRGTPDGKDVRDRCLELRTSLLSVAVVGNTVVGKRNVPTGTSQSGRRRRTDLTKLWRLSLDANRAA